MQIGERLAFLEALLLPLLFDHAYNSLKFTVLLYTPRLYSKHVALFPTETSNLLGILVYFFTRDTGNHDGSKGDVQVLGSGSRLS